MGVTTRALLGSGLLLAGIGTTTGCAPFDRDCVDPVTDCAVGVDFRGASYSERGFTSQRLPVERLGRGHHTDCNDASAIGMCESNDPPEPVRVFRVAGYSPDEVVAIKEGYDQRVRLLINDDLPRERRDALKGVFDVTRR